MPCYTPETGYRSRMGRNPETGKWPIVFNVADGYHDMPVQVPCGKCIGCRLDYSGSGLYAAYLRPRCIKKIAS